MFLVQTLPEESDSELRKVVDGMLAGLGDSSQTQWWTPYDFGRTFEFASLRYREFVCPAGSVSLHLIMAAERMVLPRAMVLVGRNGDGSPTGRIIAQSKSKLFDPMELQAE